jgi:hypothetical protein
VLLGPGFWLNRSSLALAMELGFSLTLTTVVFRYRSSSTPGGATASGHGCGAAGDHAGRRGTVTPADFQPGYLYGLIGASTAAASRGTRRGA